MQGAVEGVKYIRLVGSVGMDIAIGQAVEAVVKIAGRTEWRKAPKMLGRVVEFAHTERTRRMHLARFRSFSPEQQMKHVIQIRRRPQAKWSEAESAVWNICPAHIQQMAERDLVADMAFISMTEWSADEYAAHGEVPEEVREYVEGQFPPMGGVYGPKE